MFETFSDNLDDMLTRHKTFQLETTQIYWMEQLSPPNATNAPRPDRIAARRRLRPDQVNMIPLSAANDLSYRSHLSNQHNHSSQIFKAVTTFPLFLQRNCLFPTMAP